MDYERSRVNKDWVPRRYYNYARFGGGKGKTRINKELDPQMEDAVKAIRKKFRSRSRSL